MSNRALTSAMTFLFLASGNAQAEEEQSKEVVEVSGVIFSSWGANLNAMTNSFNIDRIFLNAKRNIGDDFSVRVTTDVDRQKSGEITADVGGMTMPVTVQADSKIRPYVKFAYLEWKNAVPGVKTIRFGAAPTPWTSHSLRFWGHRWVRKDFATQHKVLSTSDIGVHAMGGFSEGLVNWQASVMNGTGTNAADSNASKTAQLRVTVNPASSSGGSMPVSAFVSYQPVDIGVNEDPAITYGASVGYKFDAGLVWAEQLGRTQGDTSGFGYSAALITHLGELGHLVARYDSWDGNTNADGDAKNTLVGGLAHNYGPEVSLGVFYEQTLPEGEVDSDQSVFIRMKAGF